MPTFEVDDQFAFHQKTLRAGNEAIGVWVRAGAWCAAYLTDGLVPFEIAWTISCEPCPPTCPRGTPQGTQGGTPQGTPSGHCGDIGFEIPGTSPWARLIAAGLIVCTDAGFQLHDYLHWNRPSSSILADRRRAAEKKQDQRAKLRIGSKCPPTCPRGTPQGTQGGAPPTSTHGVPPSPAPAPAQSLPIGSDIGDVKPPDDPPPPAPPAAVAAKQQRSPKRPPEVALPADWEPSDNHRGLARELGVDVDRESAKFIDHHTAKGSLFRDWDSAFRTWLRNAADWNRAPISQTRPRGAYPVQSGGGGLAHLESLWAKQHENDEEESDELQP